MRYALRFEREALDDVLGAFEWYEDQSQGLGEKFQRELEEALAFLERSPLALQLVERSIRRYSLRRFPYAVFYAVRDTEVVIFAVLHHRRHPAVWQTRLP
ncbi:MAG: type II toxin-antitoxin system RelE/ParE family toxin [Bryobacteraceae bacterium]|nr:type II toxin-antitoxin system RelE/ParE family toxin [Bryobacteraceae bacterium]